MQPAGFPEEPLQVCTGTPQSKSRIWDYCELRSATSGDIKWTVFNWQAQHSNEIVIVFAKFRS